MIVAKRPDLERLISSPPIGLRGLLLHGRDRAALNEVAVRIAAKVAADPSDPFDVARLGDEDVDPDPERLYAELAAGSLLGGRRLVWLRLAVDRSAAERTCSEALAAHLRGDGNPDAFFLIEAGALDRSSPLRKIAEASERFTSAVLYGDEPGELKGWVRAKLSEDGVALEPRALDAFLARLPQARGVARQEVERLGLYLGYDRQQPASSEELEPFFGVEPEASLADAAINAFGGRLREAQAGVRRGRAEGEAGVAAVRALSQHLGRLRRAQALVASGRGLSEAAKAVGVFWKLEREFIRQLGVWRLPELDRLQPEFFAAELAAKSNSSPDELIAEHLVIAVAARARRLGL